MRKTRLLLAASALLMSCAAVPSVSAQAPEEVIDAPPPFAAPAPPPGDVLFTFESAPLFGGIEESDMLEASVVPSPELFLASLPENAGAPNLIADAGRGGHGMFLPKELAVTDEQWARLYAISKEYNDKAAPKMFEMRQAMSTMKDTLMSADVDRSKATATQSKINSLHADLANIKLDKKLAMMGVLTPEQRKELTQRFQKMSVMKEFMSGHRGMWQRRMPRRGGGACPMGMGKGGACPVGMGRGGPGGPGGPGPGGPGEPGPR